MLTHLLYLHGFRSSPASFKARRLHAWCSASRPDVQWLCPQLDPHPARAAAQINALLESAPHDTLGVVGSSLGGFYATWVSERTGCLAVVLNPVVRPARDLARYIGLQSSFHDSGSVFEWTETDVAALLALEQDMPARLSYPQRVAAVIARGDEVLDAEEMLARYAHCRLRMREGGDHALSDFEDHLPFVLEHLGLYGQ